MLLETQQMVLVHLLAAQAYTVAAIELVEAEAGPHAVLDAIAAAQNELRSVRRRLVDCQVQGCLESLLRENEAPLAIRRLSVLSRVVLNVR